MGIPLKPQYVCRGFKNTNNMKSTAKKIIISILASLVLCLNANAISDALKVKIVNGTSTDETIIRFVTTATNGFDGSWDAYKMFSTSTVVPAMFTRIDSLTNLSINAMPDLTSLNKVALFIHIKVAGTYTLQATELGTGFQPGVKITLEDLSTGQLYNFKGGSSVTLPMTVNTAGSANRFVVCLTPPMSIAASNASCNGLANGSITASKPGNNDWNYQLQDVSGTIVNAATAINETTVISSLAAGSYTLFTSSATSFPDTSVITITEPAAIIAAFNSIDSVLLSSAEILFTNNSTNASLYSWDFGDGSISDSISPLHQYYTSGTYLVSLVAADTHGCSSSFSKIITVSPDLSTGIAGNEVSNGLYVFQNEGALQINIRSGNASKMTVFVYNRIGQAIASYSTQDSGSFSETVQLNTSGTYIVQALIDNKLQSQQITIIK
jgi:PKD repeat protein